MSKSKGKTNDNWEDRKREYNKLGYNSLFLFDEDIKDESYIEKVIEYAKS